MKKYKGEQETQTYGTIGGEDHDHLTVYWWHQRAEPDVNVQEGAELNSIIDRNGVDIYDKATEAELDIIAERILQELYEHDDDEPPNWREDDGQPDEAQEWYDFDPDC